MGELGKVEANCPSSTVRFMMRNTAVPGATPPTAAESQAAVVETMPVREDIKAAGYHEGATFYEHRAFADAVNRGAAAEVGVDDGLMAVAMGVAAHRSIDTGLPVNIADVFPQSERVGDKRIGSALLGLPSQGSPKRVCADAEAWP